MMQSFRSTSTLALPALAALWTMAILPMAPASGMMTIELCNADGEVQSLNIPLDRQDGGDDHCATPCHACLSRQKPVGKTVRA